MAILLSLMLVSAFGLNKLLMLVGLNHLVLRYAVVTTLSYLSFFLYLRLWIYCLFPNKGSSLGLGEDTVFVNLDALPHGHGSVHLPQESIRGGGGGFSGGGSSGSWEGQGDVAPSLGGASIPSVSLGDDSAPVVIPIILIGLAVFTLLAMLIVCGTLLFTAPIMLGEVALEVWLGIGLAKHINRNATTLSRDRWFRTALKKTYLFFLFVLASNTALAAVAMHYFPDAKSIVEIFRM